MVGASSIQVSIVIFLTTIFSNILDPARETLITYLFGAQSMTDAFVVASVIPAAIADPVGGALTTVFISIFVRGAGTAWRS